MFRFLFCRPCDDTAMSATVGEQTLSPLSRMGGNRSFGSLPVVAMSDAMTGTQFKARLAMARFTGPRRATLNVSAEEIA